MKIADAKAAYETLSGKASDIVRQLSLAGIALIWLFRAGPISSPILQDPLLRGALFIFLALSSDLLQYLVGTATWIIYFRIKEKEGFGIDQEFEAPSWINYPTWSLFWVKAAFMVIAYFGFILPFLFKRFTA